MSRWILLGVVCAGVFGAAIAGGAYARRWRDERASQVDVSSVAMDAPAAAAAHGRGALLYTVHCAKCHGPEGHGDAEGVERLTPPPRDFAGRPWRYEVTPENIERVITQGIRGTSMPAFGTALSSADTEALVAQVLQLAAPTNMDAEHDPFALAGFTRLSTPRAAPLLNLADAHTARTSLAALRGQVVVLNFWGVSCPHCLAHMEELAKLQERFAGRVAILNICADEGDAALAAETLAAAAPSLTAHVDPTGLANGRYEVSALPTIWIVNREGELLAKAQGARQWQDPKLAALLESLLQ